MTYTLGELITRRKIEGRQSDSFGLIYNPGQYQASVLGDDAIVSFVDQGGWAIQLFVTYKDDEWVLKTDCILAINPYGFEVRHLSLGTQLSDPVVRAIQRAQDKKKAPRQPQS